MSTERIIAICANGDIANISIFEISLNDNNIDKIKLLSINAIDIKNVVAYVERFSEYYSTDMCLVEINGDGITIFEQLTKDNSNFNIPILLINNTCPQIILQSTFKKYYYDNKLLDIDKFFNINLINDYLNVNMRMFNDKTQKFTGLKDISFAILNMLDYKEQYKSQERKKKIENNLTEIINICMDSLKETDARDKNKLDKLIYLIDKANYMRGQI